MRLSSGLLAGGATAYLMVVAAAWVGALVDGRTFAGLLAVMLAWPWIDELPSAALPISYLLNAAIVGFALNLIVAILRFRRADTGDGN